MLRSIGFYNGTERVLGAGGVGGGGEGHSSHQNTSNKHSILCVPGMEAGEGVCIIEILK